MAVTPDSKPTDVSGFTASQALMILRLESGDITTGRGTEIVYDQGRFTISIRASQGGPTFPPRDLTDEEMRSLLGSLQHQLDNPPVSVDVVALETFVRLLSRALRFEPSTRFDHARFAAVAEDPSGALVGHMGIGIDTVGTVHDTGRVITFEQHVVPGPPRQFRRLSGPDRASLAAALRIFTGSADPPASPLWRRILEDLER